MLSRWIKPDSQTTSDIYGVSGFLLPVQLWSHYTRASDSGQEVPGLNPAVGVRL
jgi:hypothetical protein